MSGLHWYSEHNSTYITAVQTNTVEIIICPDAGVIGTAFTPKIERYLHYCRIIASSCLPCWQQMVLQPCCITMLRQAQVIPLPVKLCKCSRANLAPGPQELLSLCCCHICRAWLSYLWWAPGGQPLLVDGERSDVPPYSLAG